MVTRVTTVAFQGIDAVPVDVQVQIAPGLPKFLMVGLPDKAVKESSERVYAALLAHYGVVADPCRVRDPNRKGTVESAVQHTQGALKGKRFDSIDAQNTWLAEWEERWAAASGGESAGCSGGGRSRRTRRLRPAGSSRRHSPRRAP